MNWHLHSRAKGLIVSGVLILVLIGIGLHLCRPGIPAHPLRGQAWLIGLLILIEQTGNPMLKNKMDAFFYPTLTNNWDDSLFRNVVLDYLSKDMTMLDVGAGPGEGLTPLV